jgi:two-component system cell cycle response regulator DivK
MSILIVEDNDKNRMLMRDVLAFKGYRLAEAEPGEDGVRLARELHPDLILMDIQLPGINGITAFRQIRHDPATAMIPAIAVTASAMTQDRKTIMAAGFPRLEPRSSRVKNPSTRSSDHEFKPRRPPCAMRRDMRRARLRDVAG